MAPIIHCIRHAQGFHNLGAEFHSLQDPRLTPLGESQCLDLQATHFSDQSRISLITASPLSRTLHTAFVTFQPALEHEASPCKKEILAIPDAQETSDYPCDTGSDLSTLQTFVQEQRWPVDLSLLQPDWNVKTMTSRYSPHSDAIKTRARAARQLIRQRARELISEGHESPEIVLVSHGGYLHYFTDDWENASTSMGTGWKNCEVRSYQYEDLENDSDDARIVETMPSRRKRGLDHPMPDHPEQERLFEETMQGWEGQGLQRPDQLTMPEKGEKGPPESRTAATEMQKSDGPELERSRSIEVTA